MSRATDQSGATGAPVRAIYGDMLRIARQSGSRHGFLGQALARIGEEFASPFAMLYVHVGGEVVQDESHRGPTAPKFWRGAVQQFMSDALAGGKSRARLLSGRGAGYKIALLFTPLHDESSNVEGGIALVIQAGMEQARHGLHRLESIAGVVAAALGTIGSSAAAQNSDALPNQAIGRAAAATTLEELAFGITNGLRNKLACEQVALGLVRGPHVQIISISGFDDVNQRSPGVAMIRGAMEECLDAGAPVVSQRDRGWDGSVVRWQLHEQWRAATGGDAVLSIPLRAGEAWAAVLSLRRRDDERLRPEQVDEIRTLVEPFVPALLLVKDARRGLVRHALDSIRGACTTTFGRGRLGRKLAVGLVAALAAWFCFGTLNYDLHLTASVAPATSRHMAMPFEGVLAAVRVLPGDSVETGDVLCELDRRDLDLEHARLAAELDVIDKERTRALAAKNAVEARLADAKFKLAATQLAIVERRIEQATVRAPFAGVVIRGDLRRQVGEVLPLGQPLLELAPRSGWQLQLEVPESAIADVASGQAGVFAGAARPDDLRPFTVSRLAAGSELRRGRNVYVVEADLTDSAEWLRSGIEGAARLHVGPRRVWWIACHGILDALRLNYWL